jgi:hypothetical protein
MRVFRLVSLRGYDKQTARIYEQVMLLSGLQHW